MPVAISESFFQAKVRMNWILCLPGWKFWKYRIQDTYSVFPKTACKVSCNPVCGYLLSSKFTRSIFVPCLTAWMSWGVTYVFKKSLNAGFKLPKVGNGKLMPSISLMPNGIRVWSTALCRFLTGKIMAAFARYNAWAARAEPEEKFCSVRHVSYSNNSSPYLCQMSNWGVAALKDKDLAKYARGPDSAYVFASAVQQSLELY